MIPSKAGKPERGGELQIYNYADYLNPEVIKAFGKQENVSVRVTTFNSLDEAFTKLSTGRLKFDVIFSAPDHLSRLVGRKLVQPLNLELVPNLKTEVWPELQNPFYDVGPRYSVPYTLYTTGIGWRNDKVSDIDPAQLGWESFWKAESLRGRVGVLDDSREALGMALLRRGVTDLNTENPALLSRASDDLQELNQIAPGEGHDQRLRDAARRADVDEPGLVRRHAQRGHLLPARRGRRARCSRTGTRRRAARCSTTASASVPRRRSRCSPTASSNYLLDPKNGLENFVGYVGYQPPLTKVDAQALFDQQLLPENLKNCVVTREDYANGNAYLSLTAEGRRTWDQNWAAFRNG